MEVNITPVQVNKTRKRIRNEFHWKRNINKRERYAPKKLPDITILKACKHKGNKFKCNNVHFQDIRKFHESFYANKDKISQDHFILKFIKVTNPRRRRRKVGLRKESLTFTKFYIRTYVKPYKMLRICQHGFLSILGVGVHRIRTISKKFLIDGKLQENRGGDKVSNKNLNKKLAVMKFIESFNCIESHYCRSATSTRKYVSSDLNIKKMWRMYEQQSDLDENLRVRHCYFRNIFNKNYNIGFKTPRVDVCSKCLELSEKIKRENTQDEKILLMTQLRIHKLKAKAFYDFLKQYDNTTVTLSFDCQKNQVLPKVADQAAYYSRQLYIYNFTVVVGNATKTIQKENVFIYTWTENIYGKASNEIASSIYHQLSLVNLTGIKKIRLMGDGCGSQNKNSILIAMCAYWLTVVAPKEVKIIEIIFPVPGHSFMPADRVFGLIEKEIKNKEEIINPTEYHNIYERYGKIIKLGDDCLVSDWKTYRNTTIKLPAQFHFNFIQCKRFYIRRVKNNPGRFLLRGEINYKTDIGVSKSIMKRGTKTTSDNGIRILDPYNVNVSSLKLRDVDKLLSKHYGQNWKEEFGSDTLLFYKNILEGGTGSSDSNVNEDCDLCENYMPEVGISV